MLDKIWHSVTNDILTVSDKLDLLSCHNGVLKISSPNDTGISVQILIDKWNQYVKTNLLDSAYQIQNVEICTKGSDSPQAAESVSHNDSSQAEKLIDDNIYDIQGLEKKVLQVNPNLSFETFVVGEYNKTAHWVATCTAHSIINDTIYYQYACIYGGIGMGKTHLAQALVNKVVSAKPDIKVAYLSSETFMRYYSSYSSKNQLEQFRNVLRSRHLLVIDDIQLIDNKWTKTQEEMLNTVNSIYDNRGIVVFVSNKDFNSMKGIIPALQDRMNGHPYATLTSLDIKFRKDFVCNQIKQYNLQSNRDISIPEQIIDYISHSVKGSVRELQGAISNAIVQADVYNGHITLDMISGKMARFRNKKAVDVDSIINRVAEYYNFDVKSLISRSRKKAIQHARHVAIYIARTLTSQPLEFIGKKFNRNYASVLRSCNLIQNKLDDKDDSKGLISDIEYLKDILQ